MDEEKKLWKNAHEFLIFFTVSASSIRSKCIAYAPLKTYLETKKKRFFLRNA